MPILRSEPGRITFSWRSIATIYAIIFWFFMTVVVIIVGKERIHILQTTTQFDEYIYAIIFVIYLVPHFWIPFVGWGVATEVAKYKTSWGAFQVIRTCDILLTLMIYNKTFFNSFDISELLGHLCNFRA